MKRFLDIILIFAITILLLNMFSGNKNIEKKSVELNVSEKNYTIPAGVKLNILNNSSGSIDFNTCKDISFFYGVEKLKDMNMSCEDVKLIHSSNKSLDFSKNFEKFSEIGKYTVKLELGDSKELSENFEISHAGTLKKFFIFIVYKPIYNLVIFLLKIFSGSFGWAIVCVTFIIRLLLLYPQHKMMLSQRRLQVLQPKIKKIQEEYKGNQQMLGMKIMELYKKEKVSPFGSCGFLLIQMPILLVIYNIILGIQNYSNTFYIYPFLKGFGLSDINYDFLGLDLLKTGGNQGIILAISIAIIQFIQIKLSFSYNKANQDKKGVVLEKKSGDNSYSNMMPDSETLNKFMLFGMPIMVGFFTYNLFAGVGIYWGISTLFMLFQQLIINKVSKK